MGTGSSFFTVALAYNPHPIFGRQRAVSLHIIIPCMGRQTIFRLLESLKPQLEPQVLCGQMQNPFTKVPMHACGSYAGILT